jgi:hypothetical protein
LAALILVAVVAPTTVAPARSTAADHRFRLAVRKATPGEAENDGVISRPPAGAPASRTVEFSGWWHDAGELLLHKSNMGFVGDWDSAEGEPSAEWPAGSGAEHLYCAGLWVGALVGPDTLVSAAVYALEFGPPPADPVYTIYESASGAPGGDPGFDDDSDGSIDEDRLDGIDNDLDGAVDEDYAAISDEMFACAYFDTAEVDDAPPGDPHVPLGLEVYETSYAWSDFWIDDFVVIRYEITNIGSDTLRQVYLGLMVDADVGADPSTPFYLDDQVAYLDKELAEAPTNEHARLQMAHCWDEPEGPDGSWYGHIGFAVLDHPTDPDGITAPASVGANAFQVWSSGVEDPRRDATRYRYLSEPEIEGPTPSPQDWRFILSVGPFAKLPPGGTTFLEIAVVCGEGVRGIVENASAIFWRVEDATTLRLLDEASDRQGQTARAPKLNLAPPAPNPASRSTRIAFAVPTRGPVDLRVLSVGGRTVATLVDGEHAPGEHVEVWDGRTADGAPAASGIYLVRLRAGGRELLRKLVLVR